MFEQLCCCLCCKPCLSEFEYLQNDLGDCTEIYEITVKFFDPMLLTEYMNEELDKPSSVLCESCWLHIKVFHEFHETIINGRNILNSLSLQKASLGIKDEIHTTDVNTQNKVLKNSSTDTSQLEKDNTLDESIEIHTTPINNFKESHNKVLEYASEETTQFVEDNCFKDSNEDNIQPTQQGKECVTFKCGSESDTGLRNGERNNPNETVNTKCKLRKQKARPKNNTIIDSDKDDFCNKRVFTKRIKTLESVVRNCNSHPALDKGREYDKFIAEWKSQLECDICNEAFPIFDSLKVHFKTKHNTRAFVKCCDRRFDRRCSLVEHIRLHINPEMHKCDVCGKLVGSKYSLVYHKKTIHEESQKFKCSKCPKIFKQKQNLKCHLLTHVTGDKDFKCEECNKAYVHEIQLKKHIKLVHFDNRICDQCGKTLHGIGALKNHLKEHAGLEKTKFPCNECGAQLGSRITLKRHKASYHHDGTTVYVCSICGKVSTTERALKNHKNYVHERERKFKCPNCDKAFKRAQNLQEHIATHTGEALYQCSQCPKSFKINSKYHEHRKKAHPIEWEEGRKNRLEKQKIDFDRVKNQVIL